MLAAALPLPTYRVPDAGRAGWHLLIARAIRTYSITGDANRASSDRNLTLQWRQWRPTSYTGCPFPCRVPR
ncbi:hypothetical protein XFF6166_480024 [Xanthomonas citri pv. fuscans]|uniref:Uncharacterized protein n=1 Tax=Xanthomonas campestris pv. phaseoli TaxID=317013 RepID=A0A7Z7NFP3_XANCH|nr:hypothetical protein XFF6166_480024 [Xanthomonas citri pv. fuscans]SOO23219.1 hypothetical protein XFF6991_180330 [Xanthomonas phaseoli pv. phaseoli]SON99649.1 hypothetical protein XFF6960_190027 [Xanthomonas citri pv. fuscans]SOO01858.1 hypothetical protein XFF7767_110028 [Xanthomonas citri pv. fuscans]SOO08506.1 hypothetical protein XFF6970_230028 [Xanthomonas citri pv. fuscans]